MKEMIEKVQGLLEQLQERLIDFDRDESYAWCKFTFATMEVGIDEITLWWSEDDKLEELTVELCLERLKEVSQWMVEFCEIESPRGTKTKKE